MAEAVEEKKGKYRIFCPNYGIMTCCNCTQANAIQKAIELQRGFGVKVELVEITEDLGGIRIDFETEGKEVNLMNREETMEVTLIGGQGKREGMGLKMTLAEAFKVAAEARKVEPKVQLVWTTPDPFNGQISVVF